MAAWRWIRELEFLALGDLELLENQVDPGDFLGDRVLHLESGVDLEEGNGAVLPHQELAGSRALVAGLLKDGLGGLHEAGVLLAAQERRWRLLHELLVAALE